MFVNGGGNVDDDNVDADAVVDDDDDGDDDHVNIDGIGGKNGVVERVADIVLAAVIDVVVDGLFEKLWLLFGPVCNNYQSIIQWLFWGLRW
ncbi:hypothetical protein DERP_003886 [Dermatophagoides pteronyssinus]|uniref:Uncharacterized protein n=1 Tax=Dermatophagoides pteronyssinus TaxID=6956 RepID=A0ABQ8J7L5_DERPT|nr:hypothetical protein DERP_003886 [Dermatophagoides pteronyssinus]